ncbi:hypothetical protein DIPPA_26912 [Diplonema papillatum]|nr:hypothetical protein DIPPA_26912 [Diplonema papillatum]
MFRPTNLPRGSAAYCQPSQAFVEKLWAGIGTPWLDRLLIVDNHVSCMINTTTVLKSPKGFPPETLALVVPAPEGRPNLLYNGLGHVTFLLVVPPTYPESAASVRCERNVVLHPRIDSEGFVHVLEPSELLTVVSLQQALSGILNSQSWEGADCAAPVSQEAARVAARGEAFVALSIRCHAGLVVYNPKLHFNFSPSVRRRVERFLLGFASRHGEALDFNLAAVTLSFVKWV